MLVFSSRVISRQGEKTVYSIIERLSDGGINRISARKHLTHLAILLMAQPLKNPFERTVRGVERKSRRTSKLCDDESIGLGRE
ncbi:hypothetical protein V9T40_000224 [Parthenolecanium corni]|uniref:Uncharacterized protein n=1 Tax=Parthenolecanium corni TaxID=536013 RepID=A0AAN9Y1E1_9HEMI